MIAGIQPAQLQAVVEAWASVNNARKRSIKRCSRALLRWAIRALACRDPRYPATAIAARVTGDELVVEIDAEPVWIGFDGYAAVGIGSGNGIVIGIQGDAELAGSDTACGLRDIIGVRIKRLQMRALCQQIDGPRAFRRGCAHWRWYRAKPAPPLDASNWSRVRASAGSSF